MVAGGAHTPAGPAGLGVPMGARLAGQRPGVRDIQIRYGGGNYYNGEPRRFPRYLSPEGQVRSLSAIQGAGRKPDSDRPAQLADQRWDHGNRDRPSRPPW